MKRRISTVVAVTVAMLLVGACGDSGIRPSFLVRYYRGIAPGVPGLGEGGAVRDDAVWGAPGRMAVVTWGSGSCPGLPVSLVVPQRNQLRITIIAPDSGPCTADLTATTSIITTPAALDVSQSVTVTIIDGTNGATVTLPPR
ncbi:MAG: hypothetical protein WB805_02705 [Candidatus Dormiibacterota bacterium]